MRCHPRNSGWVVAKVEEASGTDRVEHVKTRVREGLPESLESLQFYEGDELDEQIRHLNQRVYVLLPWTLDSTELIKLSNAFPNLTYLMYTGRRGDDRLDPPEGARYVDPELPADREKQALSDRDAAKVYLDRLT